MKVENTNYRLKINAKQRVQNQKVQNQKGFGINSQVQMLMPKQGYETSGSVGMTEKTMTVPLRNIYLSGKVSKASKTVPYAIISFGNKCQNHEVFVGAELPPYCKIGGVGTVMDDYKAMFNKDSDYSKTNENFNKYIKDNRKVMVMPYYNGKICCDDQGRPTGKYEVHKFPLGTYDDKGNDLRGTPFYTSADLDTVKMKDIIAKKNYKILEPIKEDTMTFGFKTDEPIALYRVKGTNHFMVFTEAIAALPKAYAKRAEVGAGADTQTGYSSNASGLDHGWDGDPYAKFSKAFVQLLPSIENTYDDKGKKEETKFEPGTIICSDSQTALVPHYMATLAAKNDPYYDDNIKPTYVAHNLGEGYISTCTYKEMYINLGATPEDLQAIKQDPEYKEIAATQDKQKEEEYFKKLISQKVEDDNGNVSTVMVALYYAKQGYIPSITTVSEDYAKGLVENPAISPGMHRILKEMYEEGKFIGILNALNNPNLDPEKRLGLMGYGYAIFEAEDKDGKKVQLTSKDLATKDLENNNEYQKLRKDNPKEAAKIFEQTATKIEEDYKLDNKVDGIKYGYQTIKKTTEAFTRYSNLKNGAANITDNEWEEIQTAKAQNKLNFINRLKTDGSTDSLLLTGLNGRKVKQIGALDINKITEGLEGSDVKEKLKKCHLTVSWGRGDLQKGMDTTMTAWAQTARFDKNAFLIVGGELPASGEDRDRVVKAMENLSKEFEGRFIFMDGFAPGVALTMAADIASLPSRFAPCELTDLEAMHYGVTPIVTNCQGLKQKNFDYEVDETTEEAQTSYKTLHEFFMSHEVLCQYDDDMEKVISYLDNKMQNGKFEFLKKEEGSNEIHYLTDKKDTDTTGHELTIEETIIKHRDEILNEYKTEQRKEICKKLNKTESDKKVEEELNKSLKEDMVYQLIRASYDFKTSGFKDKYTKIQNDAYASASNRAERSEISDEYENDIIKTIQKSKDYKTLMRNSRDAIIANEMTLSILRSKAAFADTAKRKKLFKNALALQTSFINNEKLHPLVGNQRLSTQDLYIKHHLACTSNKPAEIIKTLAPEKIFSSGNKTKKSIKAQAKNLWKKLRTNSQIGIIAGAVAAVGAIISGSILAGVALNKAATVDAETQNNIEIEVDDVPDYDDLEMIEA